MTAYKILAKRTTDRNKMIRYAKRHRDVLKQLGVL